jgi:hypothetical protein
MKPTILKRNVKLRHLRYEIAGTESPKPMRDIIEAILAGLVIAIVGFVSSMAFVSWWLT